MVYEFKSHPTKYAGVLFRSRLEARWAAFFDVVGFGWEYEPIDLKGWTPDFRVSIPCGHSECNGEHVLLVEVKPYHSLEEFKGHKATKFYFGFHIDENGDEKAIPADSSAIFGVNPAVTYWEMTHGAGGGIESVGHWVHGIDVSEAWNIAGEKVQYRPR